MEYVARETWGAITPRLDLRPLAHDKVQGIVVHHTTGPATDSGTMINAHDWYHRWTKNWVGGLAYNWLVSADGRIWEGRGWNQGGATKGWNRRSVAVAYLGNADEDWPSDARVAMDTVLNHVFARFGDHLWLKVHSDFKATGCPGVLLRDWVRGFKPQAVRTAVNGSESKTVGYQSQLEPLREFFWGLRGMVARKPLRRWRRNHKWPVMAVQARLNELGFDVGTVDGVFGRRTKAGVQAFQRTQWHMAMNGVVGISVWDGLFPA